MSRAWGNCRSAYRNCIPSLRPFRRVVVEGTIVDRVEGVQRNRSCLLSCCKVHVMVLLVGLDVPRPENPLEQELFPMDGCVEDQPTAFLA